MQLSMTIVKQNKLNNKISIPPTIGRGKQRKYCVRNGITLFDLKIIKIKIKRTQSIQNQETFTSMCSDVASYLKDQITDVNSKLHELYTKIIFFKFIHKQSFS